MWRFLGLIALGMLDILATENAIRLFGPSIELNPIQRWLYINYGFLAMYILRGTTCLVGGALLLYLETYKNKQSAGRMLTLAFWFSLAIVVWHMVNYSLLWLT